MALSQVLSDDDAGRQLRDAGRRAAECFSMDRLAEAYTVIYEAVIAESLMRA